MTMIKTEEYLTAKSNSALDHLLGLHWYLDAKLVLARRAKDPKLLGRHVVSSTSKVQKDEDSA